MAVKIVRPSDAVNSEDLIEEFDQKIRVERIYLVE